MARFLVGIVFLVLSAICLGAAARSLVEPPAPPVYTARGLSDLASHGEPLPRCIVLITTGFTSEPVPRYFLKVPGDPVVVFANPVEPPLPKRVIVLVEIGPPIRVTPAASR